MNKKIYELYLNGIGQISPMIKERLDDLVELYGMEHVIVAINTTIESGGSSIKYVETVAASNLKKKVNDNGTNKRRPGARATEQQMAVKSTGRKAIQNGYEFYTPVYNERLTV